MTRPALCEWWPGLVGLPAAVLVKIGVEGDPKTGVKQSHVGRSLTGALSFRCRGWSSLSAWIESASAPTCVDVGRR